MDLTYMADLPPACLVFPSDEMGEGGDGVGGGHARDGSTGQVRGSWPAAMGKRAHRGRSGKPSTGALDLDRSRGRKGREREHDERERGDKAEREVCA